MTSSRTDRIAWPPPKWLLKLSSRIHVFLYRLSEGRLARTMNSMPVLLLTTIGRKSGRPRTTPVVYLRDGANYMIAPGLVERPAWYLNLKHNPQATIQVGTIRLTVEATEAEGEERKRLWAMTPAYWNEYQQAARRELPLMVLRKVKPDDAGQS